MRPALLDAFVQMLPRLQAEEALRAIDAASVANGLVRPDERRRYLSALEGQARVEREPARKASAADLAAMGIAVEEVSASG